MQDLFFIITAAAVALLSRQADASRLTPPVLPLVVRNPYLNLWLRDARENPWNRWPIFWTGQPIGFSVLASVPDTGEVYPLLGRPQDSLLPLHQDDLFNVSYPKYLGSHYDASTTNLTYLIPGPASKNKSTPPIELVLSFLSPITPTSTLRQSIPASYLTVHVKGSFNVDVYMDLNGQWVSGDRGSPIVWDFTHQQLGDSKTGLKTWKVSKERELLFTEFREQAEWGSLHFSAPSDVRHESGTSAILRQRFSRTGTLQNEVDGNFRGIMEEEPVFAFAKSFKLNSSTTSDSVLFTIAHIQDPVVQYAAARGLTLMRPLWAWWFPTVEKLLSFHYLDFQTILKLANDYSTQLKKDAHKSGSDDYVDIVALSARQVMVATSFAGTPDNPIIFQKEISSSGNIQTLDVIFPTLPFFLYTNPRWLAYMLEPIIEHTLSGQYPRTYAPHDIGYSFPNATGHPDGLDEYMPLEECGNILTAGLALINSLIYDTDATAGSVWSSLGNQTFDADPTAGVFSLKNLETRDEIFGLDDSWGGGIKGEKQAKKWIERSYRLWKQWTGFLIDFSLEPSHQLSTDDFAGALQLQTNLALKGILGIRAMSQIAKLVGNEADETYYKNISDVYISKWEQVGFSRDGTHAKLAYNWYGSWTTLYNLYVDSLLCFHLEDSPSSAITPLSNMDQKPLNPEHPARHSSSSPRNESGFVSRRVYKTQSDWYPVVLQRYGLPLDSRHMYAKTDWEFFAAAVTSKAVREEILGSVALWVNETQIVDRPLTDLHDTEGTGGFPGITFMGRPVVGGHFAFLALDRACGGKATEGLEFLDEDAGVEEERERL